MARTGVDRHILEAFRCTQQAIPLPGGGERTYRAGNLVLRHETNPDEAAFLASVFAEMQTSGFRISRPIATAGGTWLASGSWSAWTFLSGSPAREEDLPRLIPAIDKFHLALMSVRKPAYLSTRTGVFDEADNGAWLGWHESRPSKIARFVEDLEALREPLDLPEQLIHGDLNPGNFLIAPNEPPGIIDMAPYWRPAAFAAAICAYWFGAYRGRRHVLHLFPSGRPFAQLLLRAAIRSLIIHANVSDDPDHGEDFLRHARAAELVREHVLGDAWGEPSR